MRTLLIASGCVLAIVSSASAQVAVPVAPKAAAKSAPSKSAVAGAPIAAPGLPSNCLRLPLSDVAFGKPAATDEARKKLLEYAQAEVKKRKWPAGRPLVSSNETVSCEVYLDFPVLGTEYRCLVTATFCQK